MLDNAQNLQFHGCTMNDNRNQKHYHQPYAQAKSRRYPEGRSRPNATPPPVPSGAESQVSLSLSVIQSPLAPVNAASPIRPEARDGNASRASTNARRVQRQDHTLNTLARSTDDLSSGNSGYGEGGSSRNSGQPGFRSSPSNSSQPRGRGRSGA